MTIAGVRKALSSLPYRLVETEPGSNLSAKLRRGLEGRKGVHGGQYPVAVTRYQGIEFWQLARGDSLPANYHVDSEAP